MQAAISALFGVIVAMGGAGWVLHKGMLKAHRDEREARDKDFLSSLDSLVKRHDDQLKRCDARADVMDGRIYDQSKQITELVTYFKSIENRLHNQRKDDPR